MALSLACKRANDLHNCFIPPAKSVCLGSDYNSSITVPLPDAPITFTITSGSLPAGLVDSTSADGTTFIIEGTPLVAGNSTFTLMATDANGNTMTGTYTIAVYGLTSAPPPDGNVGSAYSFQLTTGGGTDPSSFSITAGGLPAGLTMSNSGLISGTPTSSETDLITVRFTDSSSPAIVCSQDIQITVNAALLDFNNLAWQNAFVGSGGTGTASFTPSLANGATFHGSVSRTLILDSGACQNVATITYNGPALPCNLHIVLNRTGIGTITGQVNWSQVPNPLFDNTGNPPGVYDIPFTIQDTLGVPVVVQFTVTMQISAQPDFPNSIDMVGTFSVI